MSSRKRLFKQVDVFSAQPYCGNPLAVVLDGAGLSAQDMQRFTAWTNLSECAFVLPATQPGADYKVRIFSPLGELPFAGHPTLGTSHAWLESGGQPQSEQITQECGVGLVRIQHDVANARLAFAAPPLIKKGPLDQADVTLIARGLGVSHTDVLAHAWCHNGPAWQAVMLRDAQQVLQLKPDADLIGHLTIGVVGAHPSGHEAYLEVRAFFPNNGQLCEDPVTGSLNAAIAQWLIGAGFAPHHYVAAQGTALGRAGRVHVNQVGADIWIGGASVTCIDGLVVL
jgi:PhzF family phenazine biosynthesis protein